MRPSTLGSREVLQADSQAKPSLSPITPRAVGGDAPTGNGLDGEPPHAPGASGPPPRLKPGLSIDAQLQLDEINAEIEITAEITAEVEVDCGAPAPAFVAMSKVGTGAGGQLPTCAGGQLPTSLDTGPADAPPPAPHER